MDGKGASLLSQDRREADTHLLVTHLHLVARFMPRRLAIIQLIFDHGPPPPTGDLDRVGLSQWRR